MRSNSKVRVAAMAALVAAALVMGAGQSSADVQRYPVDGGGRGNANSGTSPRALKRPVRGAMSLSGALRSILTRYWEVDGGSPTYDAIGFQRMPATRAPRNN